MRLTLLIIAIALAAGGQETPTFQTATTLVRVDVQVLDRGEPVSGLTAEDFVVKEEGVPQKVLGFGRESEPLQLLFVLDVSGSMGRLLGEMGSAAQTALGALQPADEVGVLLYARRTRLALELTNDRRSALLVLKDAAQERDLGGGSSLYAAVVEAADYLAGLAPAPVRRALLVLTDNGGVSREMPNDLVLKKLASANAVLNAAVTRDARPPDPPARGVAVNPDYTRHDVFLLAEKSGGETMRMDKVSEQLKPLLERMRTRYLLSYKPQPLPPGVYRRLEVELTPQARARLKRPLVRARTGYYTGDAAPSTQ